ncbi:hypothetical protein H8356DRAFT_1418947 [Neocallimastix lanati (nom. inval.)]|nr:hypothetical protein H8356DRAFT_1418947 [Neocallimastix sp. JGI-2020a]
MKSILVPQDYNLSNTPIYRNQQFYVNTKPTKRDYNKWFLSLYPTKFLQNSSNMNLKTTKYSHKLRWYNITLQEKGFHHTNDVLDTSNINGVIILNTWF